MSFSANGLAFAAPSHNDYSGVERRTEMRAKAILAHGTLSVSGIDQTCCVHDIAPHGVRIEARNMPLPGQRVWIAMHGLERTPARMVWSDGSIGGLAFETRQDLDVILDLRRGEAI